MREHHCRRPRSCTDQAPSRDPGHPGGAHGRSNDPIASPCHGMRCPPVSPLFASWQWLLHTGCSLEALDMTVHERNHERGDSRYMEVTYSSTAFSLTTLYPRFIVTSSQGMCCVPKAGS